MSEPVTTMGREGVRSLGAQFTAVRETRGLSLEQVTSELQIRVERLREIERDDYSQFSDPTYARMHAIRYAKYLGIPISLVHRRLPESRVCGTKVYQYLWQTPCAYVRTDLDSRRRRRSLPKLVSAALLVLFTLGGFKFWTTLRDIERLGLNLTPGDHPPALALPKNKNAVPQASATPESRSDSVGTKQEEHEVPAAETPVRREMPAESESGPLVRAKVWPNSANSK